VDYSFATQTPKGADKSTPSKEKKLSMPGNQIFSLLKFSSLTTRNLRNARFRTTIVVIAVAVVVGLLFSTFVLEIGVARSTEIGSTRLGADILLLPAPLTRVILIIQWRDPVFITPTNASAQLAYLRPRYINDNGTLEGRIANISGVAEVSPQVYVGSLNVSGSKEPVALVGFDPNTDFTILPWLKAGGTGQTRLQPDGAIAGAATGLSTGQVINWEGLQLKVGAVLEPTSSSMDQTVFFPIQTAYGLAGKTNARAGSSVSSTQGSNGSPIVGFKRGEISALLVKLQPNAPEEQVGHQISNVLSDYVVIYGAIATKKLSIETTGISTYEFFISGLMGFSVLILIASLMSMIVNERKREFGLLRSFGATKLLVSRLVLSEAGIISILGSLLGLTVGGLVLVTSELYLSQAFGISFVQPTIFELVEFAIVSLVLGVAIGSGAATYPAYVASRMDPYQAITRGE
jgi:putative ABC transport system permease protein